jgi:hypothetical protein
MFARSSLNQIAKRVIWDPTESYQYSPEYAYDRKSIMAAADLFLLPGCTALVTGARRGADHEVIVGLAPHGAKVVCAVRTTDDLAAFTGIVHSVVTAATLGCIDRRRSRLPYRPGKPAGIFLERREGI